VRDPESILSSDSCPAELDQLVDGTLPPEHDTSLARHLDGCPRCRQELARRTGWRPADFVGSRPSAPRPPDAVLQRVVRQLKAELAGGSSATGGDGASLTALAGEPWRGGQIGPYEVRRVLGRGGMGVVLEAFDPALNRPVSIKVLGAHLAASAAARARFDREARAMAAVRHEHIVAVHAVAEADGLPYLVMEYVPGCSLQDLLDAKGTLPVEEVLRIGLEVARGLEAAHDRGLVHRDVKPANILLEEGTGQVKLTDFGLARAADDASLSQSGTISGTPLFMAPEQARGEAFDGRADLFSLGTVLYCLCTGESPFQAATMPAVLRRISDEEAWPLRQAAPEVPPWLEALIAYLHAKDPAQRPASAGEVVRLLEGYIEHRKRPDDLPPPPLPRLARRARARGPARVLVAALAVAVLGGMGLLAWTHRRSHQPTEVTRVPALVGPLRVAPPPCPPQAVPAPGCPSGYTDLETALRDKSEKEIREVVTQLLRMAEDLLKEAKRRGMSSARTPPRRSTPRYEGAGCT
jgi:serine/threonine-protein kinase